LTEAHGAFEQGKRPWQITSVEAQQTDPPQGIHEAPGVINGLGNPQPFFPEDAALSERTHLGMTRGELGTGLYSRQEELAKALAAPRPVKRRHSLSITVYRPTIVAMSLESCTEILVRQRVQDDLPAGRGEGKGTLSEDNGLVMGAHEEVMD
jgi:hypothetical protein